MKRLLYFSAALVMSLCLNSCGLLQIPGDIVRGTVNIFR